MSHSKSILSTLGAVVAATFSGLAAGLVIGAACLAVGLGVGVLCTFLIIKMGEALGWYFTILLIVALVANVLAFIITGLAVGSVVSSVVRRMVGPQARGVAVFAASLAMACLVAAVYWGVQTYWQIAVLSTLALVLGLAAYMVAPIRAVQRLVEAAPAYQQVEGGAFALFLLGLAPLAIPGWIFFSIAGFGELRRLQGHAGPVTCVAISPDDRLGLTGVGQSVHLWSLEEGRQVHHFTGKGALRSAKFSSTGRQVVAAFESAEDSEVLVFDVEAGKEIRRVPIQGRVAAISRSGKLLLAGSTIWDVEAGKPLRSLQGSKDSTDLVACAAFSADERWLVTGAWDGALHVWDVETGRVKQSLPGHASKITAVAIAPEGSFTLSTGDGKADHHVRIWNVASGKESHRVERDEPGVRAEFRRPERFLALDVSADGKRALLGSETTLYVWDPVDGKPIASYRTSGRAPVTAACFSADGLYALTGDGSHHTATYWRLPR